MQPLPLIQPDAYAKAAETLDLTPSLVIAPGTFEFNKSPDATLNSSREHCNSSSVSRGSRDFDLYVDCSNGCLSGRRRLEFAGFRYSFFSIFFFCRDAAGGEPRLSQQCVIGLVFNDGIM